MYGRALTLRVLTRVVVNTCHGDALPSQFPEHLRGIVQPEKVLRLGSCLDDGAPTRCTPRTIHHTPCAFGILSFLCGSPPTRNYMCDRWPCSARQPGGCMATWVLIGAMEANGSTMRPRWHAASGRDGGQVCTSARGAKTPCQKLSSWARTRCLSAPKALNESSHNRCGSVFGLKSSGRKERVPGTRVGTWNVSQSPGTRSGRSDVPDFYGPERQACW